jgi:hypothetical protein
LGAKEMKCFIKVSYYMSQKLELEMEKCFFLYTHVSKTLKFNYKMNVVLVNLEANMGMNVNIHPHYG